MHTAKRLFDRRRSSAGPAQIVADARPGHIDRRVPPAPARDQPAARLRSDARSAARDDRIETPLESGSFPLLAGKKLCLVSILRAGNGILDGMLDLLPSARVGHIGIYREPRTLQAVEYYLKLPGGSGRARCDPGRPDAGHRQFGGGGISRLVELKARSIKFVCLVAAPEGVDRVFGIFPRGHDRRRGARPLPRRPRLHPARPRRRRRPPVRNEITGNRPRLASAARR